MKSHSKILISILILASLVLQIEGITYAAEIMPFNQYTSSLYAGLSISSGTASVFGDVAGSSTKYSVSGTLYLEQYKDGIWGTYKSWAKVTGTGSVSVSKSCTVASGYKYRTKFVTNVNGEALTKYSSEKSV